MTTQDALLARLPATPACSPPTPLSGVRLDSQRPSDTPLSPHSPFWAEFAIFLKCYETHTLGKQQQHAGCVKRILPNSVLRSQIESLNRYEVLHTSRVFIQYFIPCGVAAVALMSCANKVLEFRSQNELPHFHIFTTCVSSLRSTSKCSFSKKVTRTEIRAVTARRRPQLSEGC